MTEAGAGSMLTSLEPGEPPNLVETDACNFQHPPPGRCWSGDLQVCHSHPIGVDLPSEALPFPRLFAVVTVWTSRPSSGRPLQRWYPR